MVRLNEKVVKRILAGFRGILQQKPAWNVSPNLLFSNKRGIQTNSERLLCLLIYNFKLINFFKSSIV